MLSTLSLSLNTSVAPLTLAEYAEMPYCSALLLDSKFDASLTDAPAFHEACEFGFVTYFDEMYEADEQDNDVLVERRYSWAEVVKIVVDEALCEEQSGPVLSLAYRAGVMLGWLSALALTDPKMAGQALTVAEALLLPSGKVRQQELNKEPVRPVSHLCPRSVDSAGWPLDF